jgi:transglutaminase-like putative cysteine protease
MRSRSSPQDHFINWQQDPQGNHLARLVFPEKTTKFEVTVDLIADMAVSNPFDFFLEPSAEEWPFAYDPSLAEEIAPFRKLEPAGPLLAAWLAKVERKKQRTVDFLVGLNARLQAEIGYIVRLEPGVQSCEQTLGLAKGSCRDSGWLLVTILRHLGFAARFASGYLIQLTPDEKPLEGPEGPTHDFTDLHAWCEVYLPGAGWIGLDPTSGLLTGEGHIPLACTPEPSSAAPIEGAVDDSEVEFFHEMSVSRVRETPRTTKPYTDEQWEKLLGVGEAIERDIAEGGLKLTMGGEPTFVSIDDMDGAEWNTLALGPEKRRLAGALFRKLAGRFSKGPLLHFGQGKWYPGEQLPRWALGCFWRKDGEVIWRNPALTALESKPTGATPEIAQKFAQAFAERLQLNPGYLFDAYEDTWYYLWRERRLPSNVEVDASKARDPMERERLARVFERGLETPAGTVLPVAREANGRGRWRSGPWFLRTEKCYLIPGDSPIGYRLPLDSLPWAAPADMDVVTEPDPMISHPALPPLDAFRRAPVLRRQAESMPPDATAGTDGEAARREAWRRALVPDLARKPGVGASAGGIVRTAISFEPRDGHLYCLHAADRALGGLSRAGRCGGGHRRGARPAGVPRRLPAARRRCAPQQLQRHARPRRDRGQHPSLGRLARARRQDRDRLRGGAHDAARRTEIHDRWPPYRHRRRQPRHPGRAVGARVAAAAAARPAEKPARLLAQPPLALVPVLRPVHRADEPASAHRRGAE